MRLPWQKKRPAPQPAARQPRGDWPWKLTVNGRPTAQFDWVDIVHGLDALEQKDPPAPKQYWFLQSARALAGPHAGKYIAGCGYSGPEGPVLLEQYYDTVKDVTPLFAAAYQGQPLDLSGFEDHSGMLPANS